jgi:hypothetical protein
MMTERDQDTQLLAAHLSVAFEEAFNAPELKQMPHTVKLDHAWYRVAERAKELRA